jgi:hypothetical protein
VSSALVSTRAFAGGLPRGEQLAFGALDETLGACHDEHLVRRAQLLARVHAPTLTAKPLPVEEVGACESPAHAGAAKAVDRLPIEALGGLAVAHKRSRTGLDPQRPVGAAGASRLREPLEGVGRERGLPASSCRLDQLDQPPGEGQLLGVLAGPLGSVERVLMAADAVVEHCARPVDEAQPLTLAPSDHLVHVVLDQVGNLGFPAAECGEPEGSVGREVAPRRLGDGLDLVVQRSGRGELAGPQLHPHARNQGDGKHAQRAGIPGELDVASGQQISALVVP